jgi:Mor family transcriptional regulator
MMHPGIIKRLPKARSLGALGTQPELMLELARHFGGQNIYIPKNPKPESLVARALGLEAAERISRLVGWGDVTVPLCRAALCFERDLRIADRKRDGASENELAREFGLHTKTVRQAVARVKALTKRVKVRAHRGGA